MNTLTIQRITKARRAMMRAQNPKFRELWHSVALALQADVVPTDG